MAKYGGASAIALVDGYNFLQAKLKSLSLKIEQLTEEDHGLGDNYEAHAPVGKARVSISQGGGFFNTATANLHALMASGTPTTPQATPRIVCFGCQGQSVGAVFWGLQGMFTAAYEVLLEIGKLTKANVMYLVAGAAERGQIVQPLATKTADWNTKSLGTVVDFALDPSQITVPITSNSQANPTVITTPVPHGLSTGHVILIAGVSGSSPTINGERTVTVISATTFSVPVDTSGGSAGTGGSFVRCNSLNGAVGYQQVLPDLTGFTNYVGKLRDSADDTTYADLITFDDVTDVTNAALRAQRKAAVGTVDRYVCHDGNVTGSGSLNVFSGVSRL